MSAQKTAERVSIDGLELYHTFRGYDSDIEVYTITTDNITYSLYRKPNEQDWQCDWSKSYNCQPISLDADTTNKDEMLSAFVTMLKSASTSGH